MGRSSYPPSPCLGGAFLLATRPPPQLRKSAPRRPALDAPIAQPDVLDDRRRGVCEGLLFSADLEPQCKARTSLRNSSVTVGQGMGAVENKERTEVKVPDREPNGPLSVLSWRYSLHADANCFRE
jgi:hypothetical protein